MMVGLGGMLAESTIATPSTETDVAAKPGCRWPAGNQTGNLPVGNGIKPDPLLGRNGR